jgi:hypothetical protein
MVFAVWYMLTVWVHMWTLSPVGVRAEITPSYLRPLEVLMSGHYALSADAAAALGLEWQRTIDEPFLLPLFWFPALCFINAFVVSFYHALCAYEPLYHVLSALDIGATALMASTLMMLGGLVPGLAVWPAHAKHLLHHYVVSNPPDWLAPFSVTFYCITSAIGVVVLRIYMRRESPKWLLLVNFAPIALTVADYGLARYNHWTSVSGLSLVYFGAVLFGTKFPESYLASITTTDASSHRILDLVGSSHMLWHLAYTSSWIFYGYDAIECALRASGSLAPQGHQIQNSI